MAYQTTNAATHGIADRIGALIAAFRENMARRKVYRDTLRELRSLGPRELNDLGLNASMLQRIAYQAAYEK